MKTTNTTLSTDLLRRLALMQHLGEEFFILNGTAYEGSEEDIKQSYEDAIAEQNCSTDFNTYVEENCIEVEEFDTDNCNNDYLVLTDSEADEKAEEYIKDSLWAFNADFIIDHTKLPYEAKEMIENYQREKCEGANETIAALLDDNIDDFVTAAISADGRGHFMSSYDGEENEVTVILPDSITSEMMEGADIDTKTTFYIYRIN